MYISTPSIPSMFCPSEVLRRSLTSDVKSTADSFKNWNTCMDNKTCKIVAIVLIVVASLIVLWLVMAVVSCCCMGLKIGEGCCFCFTCCCRSRQAKPIYVQQQQPNVYNNPNMYAPTPAPQFYGRPTPAHFANQQLHAYQGYQPVQREVNDEKNPFQEEVKYNRF